MRRREFITLIGGTAAVWPLAARAQQKIRKVGILGAVSREDFSGPYAAFIQGMRELGHMEGNDFTVEWRSAEEHYERFPALIAELLGLKVDVIVSATSSAYRELQRATVLRRTPIAHLFDALRERGYEDGRTAKIELLGGEGDPERLKALIAGIVSEKPDVTIAVTSPAVLGLKQAGLLTPVVFAFVSDPVGQGIVASLAHPGGNFTGISYSETKIGSKRLEFLVDAVPAARRVAIIWGSGFPENAAIAEAVESAARTRSLPALSRKVIQLNDLTPAFEDAERFGATALIFLTDNLLFGHRKEIAELALSHHLPSMHSFPPEVQDGALMSYGPDPEEEYQRAAALADRILKGASLADLPEEPTRFNLAVNIKIAKTFGLSVPPTLLALADQVIE